MSKNPIEWVCCGVGAVFTVVQTQEIFQIISLVLTCIATLVAIGFTIYKWYKVAKADGKVDAKEVEELVDIIKDGADDIKEIVESGKPEESDKKSEGE